MAIQELPNSQSPFPTSDVPPPYYSEQESFDVGNIISVLFRRRWIFLIGVLVIFGLGVFYTRLKDPVYESTCSIMVTSGKTQKTDDLPLLADLQAMTQGRSVDTQVEILSSPDLLTVAYKDDLKSPHLLRKISPDSMVTEEDRRIGFRGTLSCPDWAVTVSAKKNTDIINITVRSFTPQSAAHYANSIAQTYLEQDLLQNRLATSKARDYVEKRLEKETRDFDLKNTVLARYKRKTGLIAPDAQLAKMAETQTQLQMELDNATADFNSNKETLASLEKQLSKQEKNIVTDSVTSDNPRRTATLQKLDDLNNKRASLRHEYTEKSPEVSAVDAQIAHVNEELKKLVETKISSKTTSLNPVRQEMLKQYALGISANDALIARINSINNAQDVFEKKISESPTNQQTLAKLMLDLDMQKNTVDLLTQKYMTLLISEEATQSSVRVVSNARINPHPVSPKVTRNLIIFLLLGLALGVGLVVLAERLDDCIHDAETAERLTGLTTMGTIHAVEEGMATVISLEDKQSQLIERFRVLRNNLSFSSLERSLRLIAVTSTSPGEGKSTCCTNLGIVMAMDGKRVLIVDCDLHRPSMHSLLRAERNTGFTNVVMGATPLEDVIVATEYPGLKFLPAGTLPPNPSELLNAEPTRQLFRDLTEKFDLVILDSPPCLKLSDVQVISTIVDGMLLLVCANKTLKRGLLFAYRSLLQVSAPLIGLVINRVDMRQHGRYGRYSHYEYYYQYGQYDANPEGSSTKKQRRKRRKSIKNQPME